MGNQPWLEDLRKQLVRYGLPRSYIRRFMEEVSDHLDDFKEETMGSEAEACTRLGRPEQLAEATVIAYRDRGVLARHPSLAILVFAISPAVSLSILAAVGLFVLVKTGELLGFVGDDGLQLGATAKALLPYALPLALIVVPSIILSIFYCGLAKWMVVGSRWMAVPCGVLAFIAAATYCQVTVSDASGHGCICIRLGAHSVMQVVQMLIPVAIGWWSLRRVNQGQPQLAS